MCRKEIQRYDAISKACRLTQPPTFLTKANPSCYCVLGALYVVHIEPSIARFTHLIHTLDPPTI